MHWIDDPEQLELLASAARQEILDTVEALGTCSVTELAKELGVPADSLYYHVRRLEAAGLLVARGERRTARRDETIYGLCDDSLRVRYDPEDPENVHRVSEIVAALLRVAERDFRDGFTPALATVGGPARNLWGGRVKAWLSDEELREVNDLLQRLMALFRAGSRSEDRQLCSFAWTLAPLEARPVRRS